MNDDEQAKSLPTRHSDSRPDGGAMGASQERQMRASVPDANSFNTRFMTNADGSTTRLRTRGGMCEYVTEQLPVSYSETTCKLNMDSGVVDLLDASFLGTADHDHSSGILYRTQYVQQVVDGPVGGITGPVIGEIKPPKSAGIAPDDGLPAESFIASEEKGSPYDKKRISVLVPPSIFTGKMRQYVQAMYGRHDHAEMLQLPPGGGIGQPPVLYMDWTKQFGTEENPISGSVVAIDTNCGIHTDVTTGEHTLFVIDTSQVSIYKLNPSACAKKLRTAMLDETTPNGDKVRIESYILSESRPDVSSKVTLDIGGYAPRYSFGYGWHFNYAGTCCDMVDNIVGFSLENKSTHYRLSFSKDAFGTWSVSFAIIEGPTYWKNYRHQHVICFPLWDYSGFLKIGTNSAMQPTGNSPFYVFYVRGVVSESATGSFAATMNSDINVCRYSATANTQPKGATRIPEYMNPTGGNYVFGSDAADYRTWYEHEYTTYTVSCGATSVSAKDESFSKTCAVHGAATADWAWGETGGFFAPETENPMDYSVPTGQGVPDNCTKAWVNTYFEGSIYVCGQVEGQTNAGPYSQVTGSVAKAHYLGYSMNFTPSSTWTDESFSSAETYSAAFIVFPPLHDAEAMYMLSVQNHRSLETGHSRAASGGTFFRSHAVRQYFNGPWTIIAADARLGTWGAGEFSEGAVQFTNRDASSPPVNTPIIVANYGSVSSEIVPTPGAFFNNSYDVVPVLVSHKTSSSGKAGHSNELGVDEGIGSANIDNKPFSFVGWA